MSLTMRAWARKAQKVSALTLNYFPEKQTVNIAQCAVSTISLDRWARAARNRNLLTRVRPNPTMTAKQIIADAE